MVKNNSSGKNPGGRPTKYTKELGDLICSLIMEGKSLNSICLTLPDMPYIGTVLRWVLAGDSGDSENLRSFASSYKRAMDIRTEILFDQMIDIADYKGNDFKLDSNGLPIYDERGNPIIDHDNVQRAKIQIDTRLKYAGKMKPKKYGERLTQELVGDKENPLAVDGKIEIVFVEAGKD